MDGESNKKSKYPILKLDPTFTDLSKKSKKINKEEILNNTKNVGGEFPETDVTAAGFFTVIKNLRHEVISVESNESHRR